MSSVKTSATPGSDRAGGWTGCRQHRRDQLL